MPTIDEILKDLKQKENFGDALLFAWIQVESLVNYLFLDTLDIMPFPTDVRVNFLTETLSFEDKYKLLKKLGIFHESEKEIITQFQNERNKLFHGDMEGTWWKKYYNKDERKRLVELSIKASESMLKVYKRYTEAKHQSVKLP